jgi:putative glutamine amidotransferase
MKRPIVLLPPDIEIKETKRGPQPRYVSQRQYMDAIVDAGGLPLVPPATTDAHVLDQLVEMSDALVLPGGAFDIDPAHYGEAPHKKLGDLLPERTDLERALLERSEKKGIPILGVCGGMQLMNVMRGGTLVQDLDSDIDQNIGHQQPGPKHEPQHDVAIRDITKLRAIVGDAALLAVNSTHHQAVKKLGRDLVATAVAQDGVVEAIEDPRLPFFIGVQWHPESMREAAHRAIYRALVEAARKRPAAS